MTSDQERSERLIAMGEMAASLAHEIRNPLGSMELYCSLLKKDLADMPQAREMAEKIHAGIRTVERIINNSLQFARDVRPQRRVIADVKPLLEQAVDFVKPKADNLKVAVTVEEKGSGNISVDPFLFNQAVLNIVLNAVEAAAEGSKNGCVMITSNIGQDGWTVTVSDNGPGINQAEQAKIFDPFYTTKQGGTGLGLPIVHSIVKAHGGQVEFQSSAEQGTTFQLHFPSEGGVAEAKWREDERTNDVKLSDAGARQ